MRHINALRHTTAPKATRNGQRRRQRTADAGAVCSWCDVGFAYRKGQGRPPSYCSDRCRRERAAAEARALCHERGGRVVTPCPARVGCSVCNP